MRFGLIVCAGLLAAVFAGGLAQANNSCIRALDGECDESRYGGDGSCLPNTDSGDCGSAAPSTPVPGAGHAACRFAGDGQCDEPGIGTGRCEAGQDARDCRSLAAGGDNSCEWANDGECDEHGNIGTGACTDGTDLNDCRALYGMRNRDNNCATPLDGICNEPGIGDGTCEPLSDTVDCLGRTTMPGLRDSFYGHDDREVVDPEGMPWSAMGRIQFDDHSSCSGTLVSRRVVLTAAHCLYDKNNQPARPLRFYAGLSGDYVRASSEIAEWEVDPDFLSANRRDDRGHDWALILLQRDLGSELGMFSVHELTSADVARIAAGRYGLVMQAGYPWDAFNQLIAHVGCTVVAARTDNSLLHQCDMTLGDSGSALFIVERGGFSIIGVVSGLYTHGPRAPIGLAVDSRAFAGEVRDYIARKDPM